MDFKPITPPGNGDGLGVMQETIQDRASRGHVAQESKEKKVTENPDATVTKTETKKTEKP